MIYKTLVIYQKETGRILLAVTPERTPTGTDFTEADYPSWYDPQVHGVIHDARRPELHEPGAFDTYRVEIVDGKPQIVEVTD